MKRICLCFREADEFNLLFVSPIALAVIYLFIFLFIFPYLCFFRMLLDIWNKIKREIRACVLLPSLSCRRMSLALPLLLVCPVQLNFSQGAQAAGVVAGASCVPMTQVCVERSQASGAFLLLFTVLVPLAEVCAKLGSSFQGPFTSMFAALCHTRQEMQSAQMFLR